MVSIRMVAVLGTCNDIQGGSKNVPTFRPVGHFCEPPGTSMKKIFSRVEKDSKLHAEKKSTDLVEFIQLGHGKQRNMSCTQQQHPLM